ncbi:MAG: hypothetical protein QOE68_2700, partial [Thermoanaerobaculia bacterium]|nr:hypothetical protein [Thermoanaerobaculia bacterium]
MRRSPLMFIISAAVTVSGRAEESSCKDKEALKAWFARFGAEWARQTKVFVQLIGCVMAAMATEACLADVVIVPPRVPQGGRAVAIAVSQSNAKRLVVATESGGLFRTFDGGVSFQHLDNFP